MEILEAEHLVVGAGVIGLAVGAEIGRAGGEVFVIDTESTFGTGISARNSEVVHSGIYYPTGSLKHKLCIEGRELLYEYCRNRNILHRKCGKLVVAQTDAELRALAELHAQALQNGVDDVRLVDRRDVQKLEPEAFATAALHVLDTGIFDSRAFMLSLVRDITDAGGAVLARHTLVRGRVLDKSFKIDVVGPQGAHRVLARSLTLSAGLRTHAVAAQIEGYPVSDLPRLGFAKGVYFSYASPCAFGRLIYPLPVEGGLGIHLTFDLAGRMRFGPDVEWLDETNADRLDFDVDASRAFDFWQSVRRYWPKVVADRLIPDYAGIRPKLSGPGERSADFLIHGPSQHGIPGLTGLFGIESPGLTSSLAIGKKVALEIGVK